MRTMLVVRYHWNPLLATQILTYEPETNMIIMAQHPQQQLQIRQKQQAANVKTLADIQQPILKATTTATTNNQQQQQQQQQPEQDGKRTLIKNQLYLIEQLQLENANLRNERDQLQLENEELKFQLQMIR